MSDWKNKMAAGVSNAMSSVYQTVVPSNARMLIDTMRGDTSDITEKSFSPEELGVLRGIYESRVSKNEQSRQELANRLSTVNEKSYLQNPEKRLVTSTDDRTGRQIMTPKPIPYDEYVKSLTNQMRSYDVTKGKTSVSYNDYPDEMAAPTFDSWVNAIGKSYSDPAYRMKTILGSFNAYDTPEGTQIKDNYNFDKGEFYRSQYGVDFDKDSALDLWRKSNGPVDFLDMLMIKKHGGKSRNVNIKLGK